MAGDTRDSSSSSSSQAPLREPPPGATEPPEHVKNAKVYEVFHGPGNANALPEGSGQNTAGGRPQKLVLSEAIKSVKVEELKEVHKLPCVRESLLTGIGGGFGIGALRAVWGTSLPKAANWAVGTFIFASIAQYEFCQYRRTLEKSYMKRAVEIVDRKKAEKEEQAQARREERRRLKEEADKAAEAAKKSSWKFW